MKRMDGPYHETTHDGKEVVPQTVQNRIFIRKAEPAYPVPAPVPQPQKKTILGLQRVNFLLIIALIVVIMAAGVGGGVGGSLAVKNAKNACKTSAGNEAALESPSCPIPSESPSSETASSTTTTDDAATTTTTSASRLVVPTDILALDCPDLNDEGNQSISFREKTWHFRPKCGTDYMHDDLGAAIVYSFEDCLRACASHNYYAGKDRCVAVHFHADMPIAIGKYMGDCFLKKGTTNLMEGKGNLHITGTLVNSEEKQGAGV